jgi:hypothetical protein
MYKCYGLKRKRNFHFSFVNTSQFTQCLKLEMLSPYDEILHYVYDFNFTIFRDHRLGLF